MSFKLANVDGKSVLVSGDHYLSLYTHLRAHET